MEACSVEIIKAKARPELKLVRDVKGNNNICGYINSKRRTKEIAALLLNGAEHLVAQDTQKTMSLSSLLARCGLGDPRSLWVVAKLGGERCCSQKRRIKLWTT